MAPVGKNEIFTQAGTAELVALLNRPRSWRPAGGAGFFLGVDLGTAYAVSVVIDGAGEPAAGLAETARLAREGLIVDFVGARELVRRHLEQYREAGYRFQQAATSYPPGTEEANARAVANILMGEGLAPAPLADEPSAANLVLGLENGVIVDVGGGTSRVLGLDRVVEEAVGAPARVAAHPELVTPLGVALSALVSGSA